MRILNLLWLALFHLSFEQHLMQANYGGYNSVTECILQKWYNGTVANGQQNIYHFNNSTSATIRITAVRNNATVGDDTPLLFVARLYGGVTAWTVPLTSSEVFSQRYPYNKVSQTLCPALNENDQSFFLDISSASTIGVSYSFKAFPDDGFVLSLNTNQTITVNPAEPMFFRYTFTGDEERVLVAAFSNDKTCGVLMVQNTKCPSATRRQASVYATMTTQAAITVERNRIEDDTFYIVVLVKESDLDCQLQSATINPFAPSNQDALNTNGDLMVNKSQREKLVTVKIQQLPNIGDYVGPVVFPLIFFGMFYVVAFIILVVSWCMADDGGKSLFAYLLPDKVKDPPGTDQDEFGSLLATSQPGSSYGVAASVVSEIPDVTSSINQGDNELSDSDMDDYDHLDDAEDIKDIYRLKAFLFISDIAKKPYTKLSKRFNVYYWNLLTVSVFYALPVVQLVLTYQRVVNASGNQDICYYNFFCARPYHLVSAFNNIYSNIGYVVLGLLFIFLVMRKDRLSKQLHAKDPGKEKRYGIPGHYGILYALGVALFMEGVMSSCYHVCPTYSNFQFDTAFMYMIGILACLRIYQTRHHDVFLNGHIAFAGFAAVIFTSVIGVVFRSRIFWSIFLILHCSVCFYVSCQIYYIGRVKSAFKMHWLATQKRHWCSAPIYKDRFILLAIFNMVNWALSIYGLINIPKDFATYLLGIIICNGLLYVSFYVIMKIRHGERLSLLPLISIVLAIVMWGVSIYFFMQGLTDWQTSSAQSREGNRDCRFFDFYDDHDLWHFLSAIALFFSFIALLTLDDDLHDKERTSIVVF